MGSPESAFRKPKEKNERHAHALEVFPQAEALLARYKEETGADAHSIETMKEVMFNYLDRALENARVFESKSGIAFPYTSVSLEDLATTVFLANGGKRTDAQPAEEEPATPKREFLITGYPLGSKFGGPFEYSESPLHILLRQLPQALEDLKAGKKVRDSAVYTLGYPTNEFGAIPAKAIDGFKKRPMDTLGSVYAEFIEGELAREKALGKEAGVVSLTGLSTGSTLAADTAGKLVSHGAASQTDAAKPNLRVTMYAPVGVKSFNTSAVRTPQMALGFVGEYVFQILRNPGVKVVAKTGGAFLEATQEKLAARMPLRMDAEQAKIKLAGIVSIGQELLRGMSVPKNIHVTEIIGLDDPLIYSQERKQASLERTKEQRIQSGAFGPLQGKVLPRTSENERVIALPMSHTLPFYRKSEFSRFDRVVKAVDSLS